MSLTNLFSNCSNRVPSELTDVLAAGKSVRIERIVSTGHSSPNDFWYDQVEIEWVVVLQGEAILRLEGAEDVVRLRVGDFIEIPAHRKHRVEWTTPNELTVWLAVFYSQDDSGFRNDLSQ